MTDERVWLTHTGHGGYFECPVEAVDAWRGLGWEPAEAPPEDDNPVIAEHLAWRAEMERQAAEAAEEKKPRKAVKAPANSSTEEG